MRRVAEQPLMLNLRMDNKTAVVYNQLNALSHNTLVHGLNWNFLFFVIVLFAIDMTNPGNVFTKCY
jgi:hypothetical protein